jgi:hypothetical protein
MKKSIQMKYGLNLAVSLVLLLMLVMSACKKNSSGGPHANPIAPDSAAGNATLYVTGSGLGNISSIMFSNDSVPAPFNVNFNTDGAIIFRVPDTAFGGPQNIIFTNRAGQSFSLAFNVLAFPNVTSANVLDFNPGDTVTLTGSNLEKITNVTYIGTSTQATILSESHHTLQIVMPATTANTTQLVLTNATGTDTSSLQFVNMANAFVIFANGNYGANIANGSWGPATIASAPIPLTRYPSFAATYDGGNWSADGFAYWSAPYFPNSSQYQYFSFYVFNSGTATYTYYITSSNAAAGYGNGDVSNPISIPPGVWTYFYLPISKLGIFANTSANFTQLGWYIQGPPSGTNVTLYFDDVLFVQ